MEPMGAKMEPRGTPKLKKNAKMYPKGPKMEAPVPQWSPKVTQSAKKTPQGPSKCHYDTKMCPKVPKNKQAHNHTNTQHKQTNNQTNKQTNTQTP